jgi:hypothetical protein
VLRSPQHSSPRARPIVEKWAVSQPDRGSRREGTFRQKVAHPGRRARMKTLYLSFVANYGQPDAQSRLFRCAPHPKSKPADQAHCRGRRGVLSNGGGFGSRKRKCYDLL